MVKKTLDNYITKEETPSQEGSLPAGFKHIEGSKYEIDANKLRTYNIFFATPCYGGLVTDQYFLSMFKLQQHLMSLGINFSVTTIRNESLVTRARNMLVAMFLETPATHLFFIDADIEFDSESVVRMLAMDRELIAGAYPKKTLPVQYAVNFKVLDPSTNKLNIDKGAVEMIDVSTGFFCVKREVFDKMIIAYPELHYKNDSAIDPKYNKHCYAFFDTMLDPKDRRYLSEDYTFCRRWQALGGKIWLDPNTKLNHVGSYSFEGNVGAIFNR